MYSVVPKLSQFAYLTAEITNNSEFPLLAGTSHIYLDSNYVADSSIAALYPDEKFSVSLGIDEGLSVERKRLNTFEETSGFFSKKAKITYEYQIKVTNNKASTKKIEVRDQLPVPQNEDITVELIKPEYTADTAALKKTSEDFLIWTGTLKPGETWNIPFSFSVQYPENMKISGLE